MKILKVLLCVLATMVYPLKAQTKIAATLDLQTQPSATIAIQDIKVGLAINKEIGKKWFFSNELIVNSKTVTNSSLSTSQNIQNFEALENNIDVKYIQKNIKYNLQIKPYMANENKLDFESLEVLGSFSVSILGNNNQSVLFGIARNNVLGKPTILPEIGYRFQIKKLNFNLGFPNSKIAFSNNERNEFALKNNFNGSYYNNLNKTKTSFSQQTTFLEYTRNTDNKFQILLKAGYDWNKKLLILDTNNNTTSKNAVNNGYHFGLTIKYK